LTSRESSSVEFVIIRRVVLVDSRARLAVARDASVDAIARRVLVDVADARRASWRRARRR